MKNYFGRFFKYMIYFVLLFAAIYLLLALTGYSAVKPADFGAYLLTRNGLMMIGILLLIIIVYPIVAVSKMLLGPMEMDEVTERMKKVGYEKVREEGAAAYYRPAKFSKRLLLKMDDEVKAEPTPEGVLFTGSRKSLLKSAYKLDRL